MPDGANNSSRQSPYDAAGSPHPTDDPIGRRLSNWGSPGAHWADTFGGRWRARGRAVGLSIMQDVAERATRLNEAATELEKSNQALQLERGRSALVPVAVEREITKAKSDAEAAMDERLDEGARRFERRQRESATSELALLNAERDELQIQVEIKRLKEELHGKPPEPAPTEPRDDAAEVFARHIRTEETVKRSRSAADKRIDAIYARAAAERRQLTDDEIEEVDALGDAAKAAESELRRSAASDL